MKNDTKKFVLKKYLDTMNVGHMTDWFYDVANDKDLKQRVRNNLIIDKIGRLGLNQVLSILGVEYKTK